MKIYIICPYGPLPNEDWTDYRYTILGKKLSYHDHEVVWLTSNFSHHTKKHRDKDIETLNVNSNFNVRLVDVPGYKKNTSFKRIYSEYIYSKRAIKILEKEIKNINLIIVAGTNFTSQRITSNFAHMKNIPFIIDVLDLWPEVFLNAVPSYLKSLVNIFFKPFYLMRENDFNRASGIVFCTNSYKKHLTEIIPIGLKNYLTVSYICSSTLNDFKSEDVDEALNFLPIKKDDEIWFTFAGSLGDQYDLDCLQATCKNFKNHKKIKFLIAGNGPRKDLFINANLENTFFLGQIDSQKLNHLYKQSDILICSYSKNSKVSMPLKAFDAINYNLPIISSISGDLGDLIRLKNIGYFYDAGDSVSLSKTIGRILENQSNIKDMSIRVKKIRHEYSIDYQYNKFMHIIEKAYETSKNSTK